MADLKKVISQMDRLAKTAAANVIERVPSPEGCGCKKRSKHMVKQLRAGVGLGQIVEDLVDDIRGRPVEEQKHEH